MVQFHRTSMDIPRFYYLLAMNVICKKLEQSSSCWDERIKAFGSFQHLFIKLWVNGCAFLKIHIL